jgi:hypothetical protein
MKIHVDISPEDYQAFFKFLNRKAISISLFPWFLSCMAISVILGIFLAKVSPDQNDNGYSILMAGFMGGIVFLYLLGVFSAKARKKQFAPSPGSYMIGSQEVVASPEGLRAVSPQHDALFQWPLIFGPEATDDHVFILVDRLAGFIIPNRSFESTEEREQFLAEIQRYAKRPSPHWANVAKPS